MNISEYESFAYLDYDYNDTCDQDGGPESPNGTTILHMLYYMLFFLSVLGNTTIFWVLIRYIKLMTDVGFYSGNLFVTLMSLDHYLAIVHAVAAMRARTLRYGILASITIWIISVIMAIPGLRFAALEIDPDDSSSVCQPFCPHQNDHGNSTDPTYYDGMWEDFSPCSNSDLVNFRKWFLPTLYSFVFVLGFLGNGLVVCVLVKHRKQTNLTDICLLNLALSDLLFVLTLPFYSHYSRVGQWTFGDFLCRFASGSHNTGFFSSIFFMVVMTLDRYMVIMHAHKVARYRTLRSGIALTLFIWMLSLCISLPHFIFTKVTHDESNGVACSYEPENNDWRLYRNFTMHVLGLVIPLLVMIVCYSRIIPILVNMRSAKKHRVVKLILSIVIAFFLFWAPYNFSLFLEFLMSKGLLPNECSVTASVHLSIMWTESLAYTHCCLNPIIYAFVGQKFMKRALPLLRKCVPGFLLPSNRDFSDSSYRERSVSRSSEVTSIM
ncbi:hypothetical protein NQZ68_026891 [Dissostichus eleginoides]|nr:hypothetical protein NQZ68_026891 [Dissostichus eleginoides]